MVKKIGFEISPKTIYSDIPNLPDPVYLAITIKARNYDEVTLYFQLVASHPSWTFGTANLGAVGSGAEIIAYLHNYGNRPRPTAEITDECEFTLKAYTDPDYTNLKWESKRIIKVVFIKSDDGTWTLDEIDNFDDGTLEGWGARIVTGANGLALSIGIAEDYAISVPYSAKMSANVVGGYGARDVEAEFYKSITTSSRSENYAIINTRWYGFDNWWHFVQIWRNTTLLNQVGRKATKGVSVLRQGIWVRFVVPLPANTTLELKIRYRFHIRDVYDDHMWLDDFKLVSR